MSLETVDVGVIDSLRDGEVDERTATKITALSIAGGIVLWALGAAALWYVSRSAVGPWNAVWGVAGVSFVGSFAVPLPGSTTAIFAMLRTNVFLAAFAVLGATIGATSSAALMLRAGDTLRDKLEKRAKKGRIAQGFLRWTKKLVNRWTYLAIVGLLSLPFLPRAPVLYAASLIEARFVPVATAILVGHFLRYTFFMAFLSLFQ